MTQLQAEQVAQLLNERNELICTYTAEKVLQYADNYLLEVLNETIVACVEIKKVQWYQWEISHLSVRKEHERKGLGKQLIHRAEEKAKNGDALIVQCTIRVGNKASEQTFRRNGYQKACRFFFPRSDRNVAVWQKVLSTTQKRTV